MKDKTGLSPIVKQMRILALGADPTLARAPTESVLSDTSKRLLVLAEELDSLVYVVRCNRAEAIKEWSQGNLRVVPTQSPVKLAQLPQTLLLADRLLRNERFDLIHVQDPFELGASGVVLSKRHRLPLLVDLHADFINNSWWLSEKLSNRLRHSVAVWVLRHADGIRVVGKQIIGSLGHVGIKREQISYLPAGGGIDTSPFVTPHAKAMEVRNQLLGRSGDGWLVLFIGRLVPQKDMDTFLKVARFVVEVKSNAIFVLVGQGRERKRLERVAVSMGIASNVKFVDSVPYSEIPAWVQASDLFLLTSLYEGTARVLMEAAASGRPIVTTDVSGARDVVLDGETGYVVPIGDATALAERVLTLLCNPALAAEMGRKGQNHAVIHYERSRHWPKMVDVWQRVIANYQKSHPGVAP